MNNIRDLRKKNNYTQKELALMLNVNRSTVAKWETGISNPKIKLLPLIADIFNCTIDDLIDKVETNNIA